MIPEVSVRSIQTFYDKDSIASQNLDGGSENKSVVVPQFTLDTGLNFERDGKYLQTLTPRALRLRSIQNQDGYPNFDSTTASVSYDQLFNPYRFMVMTALKITTFIIGCKL